ncbi:MAG: alpha-glucosidase [Lachnospiraceae bacterium]|nr:alpha-glucosidase [Lachnospiraceae bacterium]MDD3615614.1 alpha-glucosidase [Lachnospiraceae bacterium]
MDRKWWKEAVVYQIYPRSFQDSNGDGIGDLKGITSRLDYLQELGIDTVWLSPHFKSPNDDNGYDISDYRDIMDEFGTMEDFDEMQQEMRKRGIHLVIDLVVNHTSDEHEWFVESKKSKDNPYRDYYIWRDGKDGKEPNNWVSRFSGKAWDYNGETNQYYLHLYSPKQPDLNWENPKVRDEIYDMMKFWIEKGVDGFRLDAAGSYSKTEGLPDGDLNNVNVGAEYYLHGPRIHEYFKEMNEKVLSQYDDIMTVGEIAAVTVEDAKKYSGTDRQELGMIFQFEHVNLEYKNGDRYSLKPFKMSEFKKVMSKWQTELDGLAWNSLYLANHDQPRSVSRWGDDKKYRNESAKMLYTMIMTMQGTPYIYQGEELGMTNAGYTSIEDYQDINVRTIWKERVLTGMVSPEEMLDTLSVISRDNARTPMQWDDSKNGGFTTGTPWLKMNRNYTEINAKESLDNPDSIFHYMQKLIKLRKQNAVAVYGSFHEYDEENESLYVYTRELDGQKMLVVLNFTGEEKEFHLPKEIEYNKSQLYISNYENDGKIGDKCLRPYEAVVYLYE